MAIKLAHFLDRTIYVSIFSLFDDLHARPFKLIAIDEHGVWLESELLTEHVHLEDKERKQSASATTLAFFPFTQITYAVGEQLYLKPTTSPSGNTPEQVDKSSRARHRQAEPTEERSREREKKRRK